MTLPTDDLSHSHNDFYSRCTIHLIYALHPPSPSVYPYSVESHKNFKEKAKLPFTLLSDSKKEVARAFHNLRVRFICCVCTCIFSRSAN